MTQGQVAMSAIDKSLPPKNLLSLSLLSKTEYNRLVSFWYLLIAKGIFSGAYLRNTPACPCIGPTPPI
ncbi:hypothetical protein LIF_A2691 [Leptospira interrogans serovar Lai str. IPAV]|uniref:Uncharacterized protein n=1 Tax=Leptospira interrogans serogroup Icterohaemorrhagiae serovar Lai (strain 56601) TaxID=189518 RepID=D4YVY9_LEPIN|nr:hypothetical protein LA_3356a [Leptospira interrogans serovar Lai str. 56601]AER03465.1 hypothetical protein LIF_A2691 [Leptospira interrogans serovar Lai str. IPAV]